MNRKLIRTTLADVKARREQVQQHRPNGTAQSGMGHQQRTPMVLVLEDGEEIEGTIEWYDRGALKINRRSAPNLLVLKRHIKYIYKADERTPQMTRVEDNLPHATES